MTHVHVDPDPVVVEDTGDRTASAGINFLTVLIVLAVLAVIAWFLFTGPLQGMTSGTTINSTTNNNNPPAQQVNPPNVNVAPNVNVNPPSSGGTSGGSTGGSQAGRHAQAHPDAQAHGKARSGKARGQGVTQVRNKARCQGRACKEPGGSGIQELS